MEQIKEFLLECPAEYVISAFAILILALLISIFMGARQCKALKISAAIAKTDAREEKEAALKTLAKYGAV